MMPAWCSEGLRTSTNWTLGSPANQSASKSKTASTKLTATKAGTAPGTSTRAKATTAKAGTYTVKPGDTLAKIAAQFKVSVANLKQWNHLSSTNIVVGKKLVVSEPSRPTALQASVQHVQKTDQHGN